MRILVSCDKFKGSLDASAACEAVVRGIRAAPGGSGHEIRRLPVADGGDGLAKTLGAALGGSWRNLRVRDALGRPVDSGYAWIEETRTAVVEMALASGIALLGDSAKDPWRASTFGTGELLRDAIGAGARRLLLGIGGSATNDGGVGMAQALGYRFLDRSGAELRDLPALLAEVARIEPPASLGLPETLVACDVVNPLLGEKGATRVYGPQKGIEPEDFERHETRLRHLVDLVAAMDAPQVAGGPETRPDPEDPGAGAAGGLGYGAAAFLGARLCPGFEMVAREIRLEEAVRWADLVVTGEGSLDAQSLEGKAPFGVATLAAREGKQVVAFCGRYGAGEGGADAGRLSEVFPTVREIRHPDWPLSENLARGAERLEEAAREVAADWPAA